MPEERLQKIIARAGIASRRAAETYIVEGRVQVNGRVVRTLGSTADPRRDRVELSGYGLLQSEPMAYLAVYKPPYVMSTVADPEGRQTVLQLIERVRPVGPCSIETQMPRVYPVGRLDFDAQGIMLMTNDGDLTHQLLHPRQRVPRTYMVKVRGVADARALQRLRTGLRLQNDDGSWTRPTLAAEARLVKSNPTNCWLELTLFEGRNHQVKRMCAAVGHTVQVLIRTDFGGIALDERLPAGGWRQLQAGEVAQLKGWGMRTGRQAG
jgi:23S rRNA pseudouridine2605 synthase